MVRPRVFFDISVNDDPIGRLIFELFNDTAPKTCENFRALCTGEKGVSRISQKALYYKNSIIHRLIPDFMIQGGDFTKRNGIGGESIYGMPFADEDLSRPLDAEGLLCMANKGPNTNGSQFFITLRPCPHLNGKHVVFGRVLRGYDDVVNKLTEVPTDEKNRPTVPILVHNSGELELRHAPPAKEERAQRVSTTRLEDSEEEVVSDGKNKKGKRHRRHHGDSDASDLDRREKRRRKSNRRDKEEGAKLGTQSTTPNQRREETEEEYDARLEMEEKQRLAAARKRELEEVLQSRNGKAATESAAVRFKGRGRMKYVDPELRRY